MQPAGWLNYNHLLTVLLIATEKLPEFLQPPNLCGFLFVAEIARMHATIHTAVVFLERTAMPT